MELQEVLSEYNVRKGKYYQIEIDTPIGVLQISLNGEHLCTNFVDYEEEAKLIFNHWKNNIFINDKTDIKNHINSIFTSIENYKLNLKQ